MIDLFFQLANEFIIIRIEGNKILFGNSSYGAKMSTIEGLKLNYNGVCREFPDLETRDDWKEEAIERFKDKIKSMKNEEEISSYLIQDLKKYGYIPKLKQKKGFRVEKIS